MSKVAVGCASIAALGKRQQLRTVGGEVPLVTRFMPKRASEMVGGSIYWIVKHQLVARQRIIGFAERDEDKKTIVRLDPQLVAVRPFPKRAHQGWRYLAAADAPPDLGAAGEAETLPSELMRRLMALALI
ncbi:DUF1489 family protein [Sphingomonas parva]|uniref:DUF1489 family protein n=2 Tax=Sphingomonas parva TaxID=2555898 RepID=A0A4Y8ZMQ1_9SPHN|nr:DUF1489 family protein [Sphingomonas parva]